MEVHPDFHTFDPQACQHDETVASVGLRFKVKQSTWLYVQCTARCHRVGVTTCHAREVRDVSTLQVCRTVSALSLADCHVAETGDEGLSVPCCTGWGGVQGDVNFAMLQIFIDKLVSAKVSDRYWVGGHCSI